MTGRVLCLGATGPTGREVVELALERGYAVRALSRHADALALAHPRIELVSADARDPAAMRSAVAGCTAVLSALGTRSPLALVTGTDLMARAIASLVPAMEDGGVTRLVLLSALGVGKTARLAPWPSRVAFRTVFRRIAADKATAEDALEASALDWTVIHPPALTDARRTGRYRTGRELAPRGLPRIGRADVATFMLDELEERAHVRSHVVVAPRGDQVAD